MAASQSVEKTLSTLRGHHNEIGIHHESSLQNHLSDVALPRDLCPFPSWQFGTANLWHLAIVTDMQDGELPGGTVEPVREADSGLDGGLCVRNRGDRDQDVLERHGAVPQQYKPLHACGNEERHLIRFPGHRFGNGFLLPQTAPLVLLRSEDDEVARMFLEISQHSFYRILILSNDLSNLNAQLRYGRPGAVLWQDSPPLERLPHTGKLRPILIPVWRHVEYSERGLGAQRGFQCVGESGFAGSAKVGRMKHVLQDG